jgi:hypothetical protein
MRPRLNDGVYVFATTTAGIPEGAIATIQEVEGLSVVLSEERARAQGLAFEMRCAWITLDVHSALAAVGLTAAVSVALGDAGVACNVIAGTHHDHLFVPVERAQDALAVLRALSAATG